MHRAQLGDRVRIEYSRLRGTMRDDRQATEIEDVRVHGGRQRSASRRSARAS